MANHRAGRRAASRVDDTTQPSRSSRQPSSRQPAAAGGKRKAVKPSRASRIRSSEAVVAARTHTRSRNTPFPALPGTPTLVGAAALMLAAVGAVSLSQSGQPDIASGNIQRLSAQASVLSGASGISSSDASENRRQAVSRDSQREALANAAQDELQAAAEAQAKQRNAALAALAASAEKHANAIAANAWQLPVAPGAYRLTATFGQSSGLWAHTHTGLDFAAPTGTPIMSVANGVVTEAGYDGAYGNKTVVTLEDGTEIWYCHQNAFGVSVGDSVRGGEVIGYIGSTGNVTGPHLHLEVRPGAGDPVDPYAALVVHGLNP